MARLKHNGIGLMLVVIVIIFSVGWRSFRTKDPEPTTAAPNTSLSDNSSPVDSPIQSQPFDTSLYSIDDPESPWVIVNKLRPLPDGYTPPDLVTPNVTLRGSRDSEEMKLRAEAAAAIESLFTAAEEAGYSLRIASAYRSQDYQEAVYGGFVGSLGQAEADRSSARPGHSEHQSGWAVDVGAASGVCEIEECFGSMDEGKWVASNAADFGFVIRYEKGREAESGYIYEPWHLRYVGNILAKEVELTGQTLEQIFGLPTPDRYQ